VELIALGKALLAEAGLTPSDITQTVIGSPGVYDPKRDALALAGDLPGWDSPAVLVDLREAFGATVMVENDIDVAALAERAHGHGRDVDSFAFISIGTGLGMGLVLGGKLHRGAHGAAGEIGYMPFSEGHGADVEDARQRGSFEAASTAAAVVRAATRGGVPDASSAQQSSPRRRCWSPRRCARSLRWSTPTSWCSAAGSARRQGSWQPCRPTSPRWRQFCPP
jgi:predicted NBD/HSP70 family sugar kinase